MLLPRFAEAIRQLRKPTGFNAYLNSIHRHALPGEPTLEEAKRDYRDAVKQESGIFR